MHQYAYVNIQTKKSPQARAKTTREMKLKRGYNDFSSLSASVLLTNVADEELVSVRVSARHLLTFGYSLFRGLGCN